MARGGDKFGSEINNHINSINSNNSNINQFSQSGRGQEFTKSLASVGFKPPTKDDKVIVKKTKYGTLKITRVEDTKQKKKEEEEKEIDKDGNLNWDVLEANRKYKPCVKLLKKLKKGHKKSSSKHKSKSLGNLFFSKYT